MNTSSPEQYIDNARQKGWSDEKIKSTLSVFGWSNEELDPFFHHDPPLSSPHLSDSISMWDAFLHILMFISLLSSTISIIWILHNIIDQAFPSYGISYYYRSNELNSIPLSMLIVSFPFLFFLFIKINKDTRANPVIRHSSTRKALIYLTLILTFITLLISLIALVFNFLEGDISTRFLLKFISTTGVTGLIFAYYLTEVRKNNGYKG